MKIAGIIAEYNPFHKGHAYHIQETLKQTGADYCVAVMSGDFVQRGEPAVYSKYMRARAALSCGVDLVLELPAVFATGSAEDFAACAVALLTGLGAVDLLSFGSEWGREEELLEAARYLVEEPEEYQALLRQGVRQGMTWPQARSRALASLSGKNGASPAAQLLSSPNNILGIEYCKAILRQKSHLQPVTILRQGKGYHDKSLAGQMASATALRQALTLHRKQLEGMDQEQRRSAGYFPVQALEHVPALAGELYQKALPLSAEDMALALNCVLLSHLQHGRDLAVYQSMTRDLAERLAHLILEPQGWEGRVRQLKTRQYTYTRISRALTHILMGLTAQEVQSFREQGYGLYARILGFRKSSRPLLSVIKAQSRIPLVTKTADAGKRLDPQAFSMLRYDFFCSHLWQAAYFQTWGQALKNEFTQPVVIV